MKKTFPCGHVGKGQYCHRCAQEKAAAEKVIQAKNSWNERLAAAPVELGHLPRKAAEKALGIIAGLRQGKPYLDYKGKRLVKMGQREMISIPVGWSYRLVCRAKNGEWEDLDVVTHEDYNNCLASGGWAE